MNTDPETRPERDTEPAPATLDDVLRELVGLRRDFESFRDSVMEMADKHGERLKKLEDAPSAPAQGLDAE